MKATKTLVVTALLVLGLLVPAHEVSAFPTPLVACGPLVSGSYVLDADVTASANNPCFTMAADNISLNLAGHMIHGSNNTAAITDGGVSRRGINIGFGTMFVDTGIDLLASSEVRIVSLTIDSSDLAISVGPFSKLQANVILRGTGKGSIGIKVQCPALLVWNIVTFDGKNDNFVTLGKGCKDVDNLDVK